MPYTVLIVDDSKEEHERYRSVFSSGDFKVIEAFDGAEGLERAIEKKPDLIMTGIIMPKMEGFDMIRQLKKNVATADIPIMVLSHMGRKEDQLKAQELGIRDFLVSGFVAPKDLIHLALLRIEGEKGLKRYRLAVDDTALDVAKLSKDFGFMPYLECEDHHSEKKILVVWGNPERSGEFRAEFICPQKFKAS